MHYIIREMKKAEYPLLSDFLYEAIFIPEGAEPPPKSIIATSQLQVYIDRFGELKDDNALIVDMDGEIVGVVWTRIMNDYGHIDNETPSFAISLYKEYRNMGIGTKLMKAMLHLLKNKGYMQTSLAVQKTNFAVKMYQNVGFEIVNENAEEYIMINHLKK